MTRNKVGLVLLLLFSAVVATLALANIFRAFNVSDLEKLFYSPQG
jgi:hypothetical protein